MSHLPFDRFTPQDDVAEMRLLASLMLAADPIFPEVLAIVRASDFASAEHRTIYAVLRDLHLSDTPVDAMAVRARLMSDGLLEDIGGIEHLAQILLSVPNAADGLHYARIVRQAAEQRGARDN